MKWARSEKRRLANLDKQEELKQARIASRVDPVLGNDTPFLESLDVQPPPLPPVDWAQANNVDPTQGHTSKTHLNHYLTTEELEMAIERSKKLTEPVNRSFSGDDVGKFTDHFSEEAERGEHGRNHLRAVAAMHRVISLSVGSRADKKRVHIARCIDTFGRHVTDHTLPPDPGAPDRALSNKTPRAGPDTGSSEVQAAILTVKIRNLSRHLELIGRTDKHNKRNLRLLVHKRQKHLKYLKRKEKGGIRWRNIMQELGLDDEAVQNEITMK